MIARSAVAGLLLLAFSHFAHAQAANAPPPAKIEAFAWLAGYWEGEGMGGRIEDIWMPPRDGVMLGAFRLTKPDGKGFYELIAIEEFEGSLRFVVKHFHPNWVGWEEKDQALKMPLSSLGEGVGDFGGLRFRRDGDDRLVVELTIRLRDGTTRQEVLRFNRKRL